MEAGSAHLTRVPVEFIVLTVQCACVCVRVFVLLYHVAAGLSAENQRRAQVLDKAMPLSMSYCSSEVCTYSVHVKAGWHVYSVRSLCIKP